MVSVVVPVYNAEDNISNCIKSVLNQTYRDFELILINDGSTDDTEKIINYFLEKDERIKVISRENKGVSFTRNEGIALSKGEYITFLDSDDYIDNSFLSSFVKEMECTNPDLVVTGYNKIEGDNVTKNIPAINGSYSIDELGCVYKDIFKMAILNPCWNKMYKSQYVKDIKFPEDMSLGEDLIFNLRYIKNIDSIAFLDKANYFYVCDEIGLGRCYRFDEIEIQERIYKESISFIENIDLGSDALKDASETFIKAFFYAMSNDYSLNFKRKSQCFSELNSWMSNFYLKEASEKSDFKKIKYRIANGFIRNGRVSMLHLLFCIKSLIFKFKSSI